MVVSNFAYREERAVGKGDSLHERVELRARLVEFLRDPIEVATFLASVAEEAGLLSTIKAEWLVAVDKLIQLINPFVLEGFLNDQSKRSYFRHFVHNFYLSCFYLLYFLWSQLNYFLCNDLGLLPHLFSLFDISHCHYHNAFIYIEFSELYFALRCDDGDALIEEGGDFLDIEDISPQYAESCVFSSYEDVVSKECQSSLLFPIHHGAVIHLKLYAVLCGEFAA